MAAENGCCECLPHVAKDADYTPKIIFFHGTPISAVIRFQNGQTNGNAGYTAKGVGFTYVKEPPRALQLCGMSETCPKMAFKSRCSLQTNNRPYIRLKMQL